MRSHVVYAAIFAAISGMFVAAIIYLDWPARWIPIVALPIFLLAVVFFNRRWAFINLAVVIAEGWASALGVGNFNLVFEVPDVLKLDFSNAETWVVSVSAPLLAGFCVYVQYLYLKLDTSTSQKGDLDTTLRNADNEQHGDLLARIIERLPKNRAADIAMEILRGGERQKRQDKNDNTDWTDVLLREVTTEHQKEVAIECFRKEIHRDNSTTHRLFIVCASVTVIGALLLARAAVLLAMSGDAPPLPTVELHDVQALCGRLIDLDDRNELINRQVKILTPVPVFNLHDVVGDVRQEGGFAEQLNLHEDLLSDRVLLDRPFGIYVGVSDPERTQSVQQYDIFYKQHIIRVKPRLDSENRSIDFHSPSNGGLAIPIEGRLESAMDVNGNPDETSLSIRIGVSEVKNPREFSESMLPEDLELFEARPFVRTTRAVAQ